MLKNGRSCAVDGLGMNGCSCCNSPAARRKAKKSAKAKEKKAALRHERAAGSY
ncbi:hypothetical protein [Paenarthrobacter sp. YJN-5]|uniref:hypothetical protein n=1 Tax=Paenarthrobacter sp. YJN-5 TaxID=2735316 RepID=UPI00187864A7|nr:hypothetical protein [Paenarthrobacter sp. YJN-5]QOT19346.1 hypothetical protein HMI59_22070 [Paenarthrobacter sp. YJN-5]